MWFGMTCQLLCGLEKYGILQTSSMSEVMSTRLDRVTVLKVMKFDEGII
jgi:hypothetical protein